MSMSDYYFNKAMPKKTYAKWYYWKKKFLRRRPKMEVPRVYKHLLSKNVQVQVFEKENAVKVLFDQNISEAVKKAAFRWAKKRKLNLIEEQLKKSVSLYGFFVFGTNKRVLKRTAPDYVVVAPILKV